MARNFVATSDQYLMVNSTPVTAAPLTICAWVRPTIDMTLGVDYCFFQMQNSGAFHYFWLGVYNDYFSFWTEAIGFEEAASTVSPAVGEWYHVAAIARSTTDREILVNAGGSGTSTLDLTPTGIDSVTIGKDMDADPNDPWQGDIARVTIYNTDLLTPEIASLAAKASPLEVRPQNLVSYWRLIRDEDLDIVGGHNMTAYNSPGVAPHPPVFFSGGQIVVPPLAVAAGNPWNYYAQM